jgi:hypothetical protein
MRTTKLQYQTEVVSPSEAERAIYIDFEGTQNEPPSLLGIFYRTSGGTERLRQFVFDPALIKAAEAKSESLGAGNCVPVASVEVALRRLLRFAEDENRMLVCWSNRESEAIVATGLTEDEKNRYGLRLINALVPARRWRRRFHPQLEFQSNFRIKKNALHHYMITVGFDVPWPFGPGTAAKRIRDVREQIEKRGSYENVTSVAKGKWSKLLKHNEYDCKGTRAVFIKVCQDFKSSEAMVGTGVRSAEYPPLPQWTF